MLAFLSLAGAGAALYWSCLDAPLIWDDRTFVSQQSFLQDSSNLLKPLSPTAFVKVLPVRGAGRPLWLTSVLADQTLPGGDTPRVRRLVNIAWHTAGAWALLCLLLAMTRNLAASFVGSLLFSAHPLHVETVALVTYRADLMVFFFITTAALFVHESSLGKRELLLRKTALACVGLALLSKETAVLAPVLLCCVETGQPSPARRRFYLSLCAMIALYTLFYAPRAGYRLSDRSDALTAVSRKFPGVFSWTLSPLRPGSDAVLSDLADPPPWSQGQSFALRVVSGLRAQGTALKSVVWPVNLPPDPAPRPARGLLDLTALATIAFMGGLLWIARRLHPTSPATSTGLAWIPLSLLPFIGLTAVKNPLGNRYLLFATAGFAMAACAAVARIPSAPRRRLVIGAALLIAGVLGIETRARIADYADDEAFYRATLARDPDAPRARLGLALVLLEKGSPEAGKELHRAVESWPESRTARLILAQQLLSTRREADAIAIFESLLFERPEDHATRWRLAHALEESGRPEAAIRAYEKILDDMPDFRPVRLELGRLRAARFGPRFHPRRKIATMDW